MKKFSVVCLAVVSISLMTIVVQAASYKVLKRVHQSAASNREEADITIIRCSNGRKYYIYGYYRNSGPTYRAIIPPYWGNPIGGKDHFRFEQAIKASCYK